MNIGGEEIVLRSGGCQDGDRKFILSTWLRSLQVIIKMTQKHVFAWQRPVVEQHVDYDQFVVACSADSPNTIYGWACYRDTVPMFVYVVRDLRGHGVGKALIEHVRNQ